MKALVATQLRHGQQAQSLLQGYVSTITNQVASVTRHFVTGLIRENNQLIDAALRSCIPDYANNESEFVLVRHQAQDGTSKAVEVMPVDKLREREVCVRAPRESGGNSVRGGYPISMPNAPSETHADRAPGLTFLF